MKEPVSRLKIKDLPQGETPYEKLEAHGAEMLSNAELLAIIIRSGSCGETSVSLAQRVIRQHQGNQGLRFLHDISLEQLRGIKGVGRVKAIQIKALAEISKRVSSAYMANGRIVIKSPGDACLFLMEEMRCLKKEVFKVIMLDTKNQVLKAVNISIGSLNASIAHPREVFSEAVKASCSSLILAHNHPSGDPEPSLDDLETTKRLASAGNIMGIKVQDHIIIGEGKYVSLKERGIL